MIYSSAEECPLGDVEICDPPYSQDVHARAVSNNPGGVETGTCARDFGFDCLSQELRLTLASRILDAPRWAVVFTDIESVGLWRDCVRERYVRSVPWVRWSQPQKSGDRPCSGCEMTCIFHGPGRKSWNGLGGMTHWWARSLRGKNKYSAEKPLDLMLAIVSAFSDPGDLVADPTCGMGTTLLAARLLGRRYVGAEICDEIRSAANDRVEGDLSPRDRERAERWVSDMLDRWAAEATSTPKAFERRERSLRDVAHLGKELGV